MRVDATVSHSKPTEIPKIHNILVINDFNIFIFYFFSVNDDDDNRIKFSLPTYYNTHWIELWMNGKLEIVWMDEWIWMNKLFENFNVYYYFFFSVDFFCSAGIRFLFWFYYITCTSSLASYLSSLLLPPPIWCRPPSHHNCHSFSLTSYEPSRICMQMEFYVNTYSFFLIISELSYRAWNKCHIICIFFVFFSFKFKLSFFLSPVCGVEYVNDKKGINFMYLILWLWFVLLYMVWQFSSHAL